MKNDIKNILKKYYEHMCGVDDYGCDGCIKYENTINKYIIKAKIEENKKYLNPPLDPSVTEDIAKERIHKLNKELKEINNEL